MPKFLTPYLLSIFIGLLASLLYNITLSDKKSKSSWVISGLILFVLCFESYAYHLHSQSISTWFLYNVCYIYIETLILFYYFRMISPSVRLKKYTTLFPFILVLTAIINSLFFQHLTESYQSYSYIVASVGLLTFCSLYLLEIVRFNHYNDTPLYAVPHFWNVSILFMFYSSTFLYSIFASTPIGSLGDDGRLASIFIYFNRFLAGLMYVVLGFSFYLPRLFKEKVVI